MWQFLVKGPAGHLSVSLQALVSSLFLLKKPCLMKFYSLLIVPVLIGLSYSADLYEADFSVDGQGSTHDSSGADELEASPIQGANWSIFWDVDPATDGSTNRFITEGGLLISDDWGGEAFFETEEIDVSGLSTVNILALASTRGSAVFNAAAEGFHWYYVLDGIQTDGPRLTTDGSLDFDESVDVSGASNLKVGFSFNVNGAGDGFDISSITVNDGVPSPEMSFKLSPTSISENGGVSLGTIEVNVAPESDLTLSVEISDPSEAASQATVTIPSGSLMATFEVSAQNDTLADGPQAVVVTVKDPVGGYGEAQASLVVADDEPFTPAEVVLNEIRINANQAGDAEYFELKSSELNASLDRIWLVVIAEGSAAQNSGVVVEALDLSGKVMDGNFFVAADPEQSFVSDPDMVVSLNFVDDNCTILVVSDFASIVGDDLDGDDDGTLDSAPWGKLLDAVSLINPDAGFGEDEQVYAATLDPGFAVIGPDGSYLVAHAYRDSNDPSQWVQGIYFADDAEAGDTPGFDNGGVVDPGGEENAVISRISVDASTGRVVLTATGLGTATYVIQSSADLGVSDPWSEISGGFSEVDVAEGVEFIFTDLEATTGQRLFYRIVGQ